MLGLLGKLRQVAVGGVFHHKAHTVTRTIARYLRQLKGQHLHILDVLTVKVETVHDEGQQMVHARTILPVLQTDDEGGKVGTSTREHTVTAAYGKTL